MSLIYCLVTVSSCRHLRCLLLEPARLIKPQPTRAQRRAVTEIITSESAVSTVTFRRGLITRREARSDIFFFEVRSSFITTTVREESLQVRETVICNNE